MSRRRTAWAGGVVATMLLAVAGVPVAAAQPSSNRAPAAVDDVWDLAEDDTLHVRVVENDSDPDGDPLDVIAVTRPVHGTATLTGLGNIHYKPALNWTGVEELTYTVSDGRGN